MHSEVRSTQLYVPEHTVRKHFVSPLERYIVTWNCEVTDVVNAMMAPSVTETRLTVSCSNVIPLMTYVIHKRHDVDSSNDSCRIQERMTKVLRRIAVPKQWRCQTTPQSKYNIAAGTTNVMSKIILRCVTWNQNGSECNYLRYILNPHNDHHHHASARRVTSSWWR